MERDELLEYMRELAASNTLQFLVGRDKQNRSIYGCSVINAAILEIQLRDEEVDRLKERIHELECAAMTPQSAVNILRNANLGGNLRLAADMGIEALEREIGGNNGKIN